MNAYASDHYELPLPPGHRFPMSKYSRLRARVAAELRGVRLCEPPAASLADWGTAHCQQYVARVLTGELTPAEVRAIGFPWSERMVERSRRSAGATLAAARDALTEGVAVNLAGGTHHASRDRGAGYCVFNDAAVATRTPFPSFFMPKTHRSAPRFLTRPSSLSPSGLSCRHHAF